jgi:hypothetical protein
MTGILPFQDGSAQGEVDPGQREEARDAYSGTVIWLPTAGADEAGLRQSGVMSVSGVCQAEDRELPGWVAAGLS